MQGYRASLVQELKEDDPALRIEWAELWLEKVRQNPIFPDQVLWTDEAIFHLNGHVNRRNAITWAMTHPHISMDKPYQKKGIMVWAGPINWTILLYQGNCHRREISLHAKRRFVANFLSFI